MELEVFLIQFEDGLGFGWRPLLKVPKPSLRVKTVTKKSPSKTPLQNGEWTFPFPFLCNSSCDKQCWCSFCKTWKVFFPCMFAIRIFDQSVKVPKPFLRLEIVRRKDSQRLLYKMLSELFLFHSHAIGFVTNSTDAHFAKLERWFFPARLRFVYFIKEWKFQTVYEIEDSPKKRPTKTPLRNGKWTFFASLQYFQLTNRIDSHFTRVERGFVPVMFLLLGSIVPLISF